MMKKIVFAAIVALAAIVTPALAMDGWGFGSLGYGGLGYGGFGAYGTGCGTGIGAAASSMSYGAPQDCMATVSCNIPVTQMVPYMTSKTEMQPVNYPVCVPVQSTVTVPKAVIVPEQVPVTTYRTETATTAVPVQVPDIAYQPCTTMMPQTKTFSLGCADTASMMGGISPYAAMGRADVGYGAGMARPAAAQM